jgi:glycosyltransferase involved in cell wall biosynthesis
LHKEVGFDIAHHVTFGNDWIPSFIGAFLPVPFIWGPVGGGQDTPRELRREYSLYGRLAEQTRRTAQWFGRRDLVRRRSLARAKAVLVCNRETKAKMPKKYEHKVLFFPVNGISEEDLMIPGDVSGNGSEFRVLTAGRLHPLKGFALAVRSFERFSKTCPDSTLVILGEGPEEDRLRRLVQRLGIESQVRFLSWLPREDVLREMSSCSVFLFPSFRDGGGAVVVEAMACGRPVVVLNSGGPGLHIEEPWGFCIEPKRPEDVEREISKALELLYVNPGLRTQMGDAARKRAKEYYLWDRLGERLRNIYEEAWTSTD